MPLLLFVVSLALGASQSARPPIAVAVAYGGPTAAPPTGADALRRDLAALRRAGFNAVEPLAARGEMLATIAKELGLWVVESTPGRSITRIEVGPGALTLPRARLAFWAAIASGARDVTFAPSPAADSSSLLPLGETAGIVTRNEALFVPLRPRERGVREILGASRPTLDVKLLESDETFVILGLNHGSTPLKATIAFDPDIPEAIWQNMETGTSLSFLMTPTGPVVEHLFAPNDALVLMIRKKLRRHP